MGLLKQLDVDFAHLKHGLHDPARFFLVGVSQQLAQRLGNDLPGEPEFVLEPAALAFVASRGEPVPEFIDFLLGFATDEERDRLGEFEMRTAIQRHEFLALQLEISHHQGAGGERRTFPVSADFPDLGVLENGGVETDGLLGVVVEPKKRGD